MSFGISVGDFLAVGSLALKLYFSYKDGPSDFRELCRELLTLHTILEQLQLDIDDPTSIIFRCLPAQREHLKAVVGRCEEALVELDELKAKYTKLDGGKQKVSWSRFKYGKENLGAIRHKLSIHLHSISVYLASMGNSSLSRIEQKLETLNRIGERIEERIEKIDERLEKIKRTKEGQNAEAPEAAIILAPDYTKMFPWGKADVEDKVDEIIDVLRDNHGHNEISKEELEENREFIGALVLWKDRLDSEDVTAQDRSSCASDYHRTTHLEPPSMAERSTSNHASRYFDQPSRSNYRQPTIDDDDDEANFNNDSPIYPAPHKSNFSFTEQPTGPVYGDPNFSFPQHGGDDFTQASHGSGRPSRNPPTRFDYSFAGEQNTDRIYQLPKPPPIYAIPDVEPLTIHSRREHRTSALPSRRPGLDTSYYYIPAEFGRKSSPGAPCMLRNSGGISLERSLDR